MSAPVPMTPLGMPVGAPTTMPMGMVAGVNAPQYGMPMCGTPIGLPGPPSVPLGVPAGLKEHVIKNHTHVCIAETDRECVKVDVKQVPGIQLSETGDHVRIVERTTAGVGTYHQPLSDRRECVRPDCASGNECPCEGEGQVREPGAGPGGALLPRKTNSHLINQRTCDNGPIHPLSGDPSAVSRYGELPAGCQC